MVSAFFSVCKIVNISDHGNDLMIDDNRFNEKSGRWETPQPWNEEFRKYTTSGKTLQMVDRKLVHDVDK